MKPFWQTQTFQIRWAEPLGEKHCPYAYRWVFIFFNYSIRIHHFLRSDDKRYLHDHAWWFYTFVLNGSYTDVAEIDGKVVRDTLNRFQWRYRPAEHRHCVEVQKDGAWTILFTGKPFRNWGFWVDGKMKRPLKYFHKFGHPPCSEQ